MLSMLLWSKVIKNQPKLLKQQHYVLKMSKRAVQGKKMFDLVRANHYYAPRCQRGVSKESSMMHQVSAISAV
ncbi:hypothetical protein CWC13_11395, partial [Pseudoalteromonas ruthenica]